MAGSLLPFATTVAMWEVFLAFELATDGSRIGGLSAVVCLVAVCLQKRPLPLQGYAKTVETGKQYNQARVKRVLVVYPVLLQLRTSL